MRLAAASPIPFAAESHGSHERHPIQHAMYIGGTTFVDGMVHLSDAPGFGVEIDWDAIKPYRV